MSEPSLRSDPELQKKYSDLLSNYKKAVWGCAVSLFGLTGTYLYSKYQIFRKQKIIDQKDNEIQSQKQELVHLKNQAKQINKQLAEQVKVILKNLKNNVMNDPNMQSFSNSLKTEINSTFDQINGAVKSKVEELKHFNYKESMEKWYMANLMGTSGLKLDRVRRIEIVEAYWQHPNPEVLKDGYALFEGGYAWRKDSTPSNIDNCYKSEFKKMKEYFQKKNSYEARGVEIHANTENLGDTFGKFKILQIRYRCWGFDIKSGAFTTPLYMKMDNSEQLKTEKTKIIGEGQESYVECSDNEWFKKE